MSDKPPCQVLGCDKKTAPRFTVCYSHIEGSFLGAFRTKQPHADLATRVAADIYVRDYVARNRPMTDAEVAGLAVQALKWGRIFAEAVAKEGK